MGAYDVPEEQCPYCPNMMQADFVDVGVGMQQCGPYHCYHCGASEIGPEYDDWCYKDRDGNTIYTQAKRKYWAFAGKKFASRQDFSKCVMKFDAPVTEEELQTGYYRGDRGQVSPYANTVGGQLVDHITAKQLYDVGLLDKKTM